MHAPQQSQSLSISLAFSLALAPRLLTCFLLQLESRAKGPLLESGQSQTWLPVLLMRTWFSCAVSRLVLAWVMAHGPVWHGMAPLYSLFRTRSHDPTVVVGSSS